MARIMRSSVEPILPSQTGSFLGVVESSCGESLCGGIRQYVGLQSEETLAKLSMKLIILYPVPARQYC